MKKSVMTFSTLLIAALGLPAAAPCAEGPDYFLDYIESKSQAQKGPWIDTGVPATPLTAVSMDVQFTSTANANQNSLFGLHYGMNEYCFLVYVGEYPNRKLYFKYVDGSFNDSGVSTVTNIGVRLTITLDGLNKTFSVVSNGTDGVRSVLASSTLKGNHGVPDDYASPHTIPLFIRYHASDGTTNITSSSCAMKLFGCSIWTNGVPVRRFRPAEKDGVVGLWETIGGRFYTNGVEEKVFHAGPRLKRGFCLLVL